MSAHQGLMPAYQMFFVGAAFLGIPALLLFLLLAAQQTPPRVAAPGA
jgi:hypothetical protein